jgi:hypothetical protein
MKRMGDLRTMLAISSNSQVVTRRYIPEDRIFHRNRIDNLKFYIFMHYLWSDF